MKSLFIVVLVMLSLATNGQSIVSSLKNESPLPPTEQGLIKYIDFALSSNTGAADINIPLYEIKTKELSLPISINYNASGIRVADEAGNIGLGWNILSGGLITKSVRGKPDDGSYWNQVYPNLGSGLDQNSKDGLALTMKIVNGVDGAPDLFNYNFLNNTGRFIFDKDNNAKLIPQKKLIIQYYGSSDAGVPYLKVIGEDGTLYFFEAVGKIASRTATSVSTNTYNWYLTKIQSANLTDEINLTYTDTYYEDGSGSSQAVAMITDLRCGLLTPNTYNSPSSYNYNSSRMKGKQLTSIKFKGGTVSFETSLNRLDNIYTNPAITNPKIDNIIIKSDDGNLIKSFQFQYGYYNETSKILDEKRLRLDGIKLCDNICDEAAQALWYKFKYNSIALPPRSSSSQDHWGYYNGANNQYLIPSYTTGIPYSNQPSECPIDVIQQGAAIADYKGADREVNPNFAGAGMLESIQYPTGGNTTFQFESNENAPIPEQYTIFNSSTASTTLHKFDADHNSNVSVQRSDPSPITPNIAKGVCAQFTLRYSTPRLSTDPGTQKWKPYGKVIETNIDGDGSEVVGSIGELDMDHTSITKIITLKPNKYYVVVLYSSLDQSDVNGFLTFYTPNVKTKIVRTFLGGLRIKKKTVNELSSEKATVTNYEYKEGYTIKPNYVSTIWQYLGLANNCSEPCKGAASTSDGESNSPEGYSKTTYTILTAQHKGFEPHVNYAQITEKIGENGDQGKIIKQFTINDATNPDAIFNWRVGNLIKQQIYDAKSFLISETTNDYSDINFSERFDGVDVIEVGHHPCLHPGAEPSLYSHAYSIRDIFSISEWFYLKRTTEKYFDKGLSKYIQKTTDYQYLNPAHKQLSNKIITSSIGNTIRASYKYTADFPLSATTDTDPASSAIAKMNIQNRVAIPLEEKVFTILAGGSQEYLTQGNLHTYIETQPDKLYQYETYTYRLDKLVAASSTTETQVTGGKFNYEALVNGKGYEKVQTLFYSNTGNLNQVAETNGLNTVYLWGYNNAYKIAEIKNATNSDVLSALGISRVDLDLLAAASSPSADYISKINNARALLTNAMVTTYSYKPLVGMTKKVNENLDMAFYEYDRYNRISVIRDKDSNIRKMFCYNYAGQLEQCPGLLFESYPQSQTFTRNNCGSNFTGGTATYTIPKGKYTSASSQEDVDMKAYNDLNTNGQAYANINGACIPYVFNQALSRAFTRNNCSCGLTGSSVTYTVPANTYSGATPADATSKAQNDINTNGQNNANSKGTCTKSCTDVSMKVINCVCTTGTFGVISRIGSGVHPNFKCTTTCGYIFPDGTYKVTSTNVTVGECSSSSSCGSGGIDN